MLEPFDLIEPFDLADRHQRDRSLHRAMGQVGAVPRAQAPGPWPPKDVPLIELTEEEFAEFWRVITEEC
jgi:hypothetical protein